MQAVRVALVSPQYPPQLGGVEHHVSQLAEHLAAAGDDVEVLTLADGAAEEAAVADGVTVRRLPAWATGTHVPVPRGLRAALRTGRYDVVHAHNYHSLLPLVAATAGTGRLVVTLHYHGRSPSPGRDVLLRGFRPVGRRVVRAARAVICVSESERALALTDLGVSPDRVRVIPNGVDVARLRAAEPYPDEAPVVLSLGRLEAYKRVDRLMEAFGRVDRDAQLVVVGDGPERARLQEAAAAAAPGRVRVLGRVSDDEVARWLTTARVVVSLSELEAFGLTLLEGASVGAAVVASDIPAHREVAQQIGPGIRVVPRNAAPADVARLLTDALDGPRLDPVPARTWGEVAEATRQVYAEVVGDRGPA